MSGGFANPIVGGGGALVYPSIHSPNFVTQVSGWTIKKDGSAEFNNLSIRGTFNGTDFVINSNGAFFYSSTPATGNLIASIATVGAPDDGHGNAYIAGITSYSGAGPIVATELSAGALSFLTAATEAGPYVQHGRLVVSGTGSPLSSVSTTPWVYNSSAMTFQALTQMLLSGSFAAVAETSAVLEIQGQTAAPSFTGIIGGAAETWHTPGLNAGYSSDAGSAPVGYQFEATNGGRVRLRGQVDLTAGQAAFSAIFTLPAGYQPVYPQYFETPNTLNGWAAGKPSIQVNAAGTVQPVVAGINGNNVTLDGIVIELD